MTIATIHLNLPFRTPSINMLYYHFKNKKCLTKEARQLRSQIEAHVTDQYLKQADLMDNQPLSVEIYAQENWLTKKGDIKKKDVANKEKFLVDSVFKALGLDDKLVFELTIKKVQSKFKESTIVVITQLQDYAPHTTEQDNEEL